MQIGKFLYDVYNAKQAEQVVYEIIQTEPESEEETPEEKGPFTFTHEQWDRLHAFNPDFIGWMAYEDEFISEPIVQGKNNEYYLDHYIDGTYSGAGAVFVDYQNTVGADRNVTMYGHHVFYDGNDKFSPLLRLADQSEYEKHYTFKIWYEEYVAEYEITNIYKVTQDSKFVYQKNVFYDNADLQEYYDYINANNLITPKSELGETSRFVTLQTCITADGSELFIATCKEKTRESY